jgi:hypothetical protein
VPNGVVMLRTSDSCASAAPRFTRQCGRARSTACAPC